MKCLMKMKQEYMTKSEHQEVKRKAELSKQL